MQSNNKTIQAVVGILKNTKGEVLIAERRQDQFMPGYWELPGGKIETGESNETSLARELKEELGVEIFNPTLMHTMCHQYPEKTVYLWIYSIDSFAGEVRGAEGQNVAWHPSAKLHEFNLLPTMKAIIHKLTLPDCYWITPNAPQEKLIEALYSHLKTDTKLIQLRSKTPLEPDFITQFYQICQASNAQLILNTPNKTYQEPCDGWHLTTKELLSLSERPCGSDKLLGASTHNAIEAKHAEKINADYISIAPVEATKSHADSTPLGWAKATELTNNSNLPAYLLGGMSRKELSRAHGILAQGVAGISAI